MTSVFSADANQQSQVIWVVNDGTAGMRLQALALGEAMLRAKPDWQLQEFIVTPHGLTRALPRLASVIPGMPLYGKSQVGLQETRPHMGQFPDILITCGRRMAGFGLALRRRAHANDIATQLVHLQDPRISSRYFDALIVPQHDWARGDNVVLTKGSLNRLTLVGIHKAMMDLSTRWLGAARKTSVTVMLGGDNRRYKITPQMADEMIEKLTKLARENNMQLLLIPSRRTPEGLVEKLVSALPKDSVLTPEKDEKNPYPGVLGLGQAVIVTSDSVNMVSEAAITGKPVLVLGWRPPNKSSPTGETRRIAAFHKQMLAEGHTAIFDGTVPSKRFNRLDEIDGITQKLLSLLDRG
jgi:mitochondrial fission protein ELM1